MMASPALPRALWLFYEHAFCNSPSLGDLRIFRSGCLFWLGTRNSCRSAASRISGLADILAQLISGLLTQTPHHLRNSDARS